MGGVDNFEREIKLALTDESSFRRLLAHLPLPHLITRQKNLFFDSPNRELGAKRWAMRLRRENSEISGERNTIALKGPSSMRDGVTIRHEHELYIPIELAERIQTTKTMHRNDLGRLAELIAEIRSDSFVHFVSFENLRTTAPVVVNEITLQFEADATTYADGTIDYELEIELTADQSEMKQLSDSILTMLLNWNIEFTPQSKSKFERALQHVK